MQALYAFYQNEERDLAKCEKDLFTSIDKIYDLYIHLLTLLPAIRNIAQKVIEENKSKKLPTPEDLNPNLKFTTNPIFRKIEDSSLIRKLALEKNISWQNELELLKNIFTEIKNSEEYSNYLNEEREAKFICHKDFIITIYKYYISQYEPLENYFEGKNIHWCDDIGLVNSIMLKTILNMMENEELQILPLYKNQEEDRTFAEDLFRKTILHDAESMGYISNKTRNWDIDRIAMMDVLLMKMAITEILYFETVPIKVSLNEYIEISKLYSTPKSKIFINGILDKLVHDFRDENKLVKTGRGLVDTSTPNPNLPIS